MWDLFIKTENYSGLISYVFDLDTSSAKLKKRSDGMKERLLSVLIEKELYSDFMYVYDGLDDEVKSKENIAALLLDYYSYEKDTDSMWKIVRKLKKIRRRHLIVLFNFYMKNLDNDSMRIIFQMMCEFKTIFIMEDFQDFMNIPENPFVTGILEHLLGMNIVFSNLFPKIKHSHPKSENSKSFCCKCKGVLKLANIDCESMISDLIKLNGNNSSHLLDFIDTIKTRHFDIVIDTANIFFFILKKKDPQVNKDSFEFLTSLLSKLKKMGYISPLLIIHNRHKKTVKKYGYDNLFFSNFTYWTPPGMNDDHFSLIGSWYKYPTPVLTCDMFRDHKFVDPNIFQWYEDMHMSYDEKCNITHCRTYSNVVQDSNNHYHVSCTNGDVVCV